MRLKLKQLLGWAFFDNPISKSIKENKFSNYKLNLSELEADPRDWKHIKRKIISSNIDDPEFSRRKISPKVKDQGNIGSCVGHSGRVLLGSAKIFRSEEPSPMWIYQKGKKYDAWAGENYSGTSIKGAAMATKTEGCCFESFWPYTASENTEPKEGADLDASYKKIHSFYTIPVEETDEIKSMLLDRPLWYGFMVHSYFFSLGFDGVVDTEKYLASNRAGGHAVCMIGWKTIGGKLYWEFQNSWGIFHGNLGCFYLEDALFKKIIINSVGPYYVEINDGYINPEPDPVEPDPDPEPINPDPIDPEPDPEPVEPDPNPVDPEPDPVDPDPEPVQPDPKKPWYKNKIILIASGSLILLSLFSLILFQCSSDKTEIPNPPYIDENGNVDWDKKFQNEINK